MALQMDHRLNHLVPKAHGYNFADKSVTHRYRPKASGDKHHQENTSDISRHVFPKGVRAPILAELSSRDNNPGKSIRLDIVTNRREATVRFSQPESTGNKKRSRRDSNGSRSISPRSLMFLRQDGTTYKSVQNKGSFPFDAWDTWRENMINKTKDARDVLYKNTYTDETSGIRYNPCKLPRISSNRPWTVDGVSEGKEKNPLWDKNMVAKYKININRDMWRPQTMNSQRLYNFQRRDTKYSDNCFEVRRINTNIDLMKDKSTPLTALVRQPSDLGMETESNQRPLTHESTRPKPALFGTRRPLLGRCKQTAMLTEREYKSVEAYKEYVNSMQRKGLEGKATREGRRTARNSLLGTLGYDNQALQSVIDENKPHDDGDHGKSPFTHGDKNSIVIEIRSMWDEQPEKDIDNGRSCPVNSPVPDVT